MWSSSLTGQSAPGPDHVTWAHIKKFVFDLHILELFTWLCNSCIHEGYWLDYFKLSKTVVSPKLNKPAYNIPKVFHPIVLLNTLGKLFEKAIADRLQWDCVYFGFLHSCQFGGVCQNSTEDTGVYLVHLIHAEWSEGLKTSVIAFDLNQ